MSDISYNYITDINGRILSKCDSGVSNDAIVELVDANYLRSARINISTEFRVYDTPAPTDTNFKHKDK